MPVLFDVPIFESLTIDDGRPGVDSAAVYGSGDADGIAAAGERIMLYSNGHRLRVYTDDPWVEKTKEKLVDEVLPAKWPDGYTLSSVIKIDPRCPEGHWIEGVASYETKTFMPIERKLTWGKVRIRVGNSRL